MKINEVPEGEIFTIDETTSYPKLKLKEGYIDMRDRIVNKTNLDFDCRIMTIEEVGKLFRIFGEEVEAWKEEVLKKEK